VIELGCLNFVVPSQHHSLQSRVADPVDFGLDLDLSLFKKMQILQLEIRTDLKWKISLHISLHWWKSW